MCQKCSSTSSVTGVGAQAHLKKSLEIFQGRDSNWFTGLIKMITKKVTGRLTLMPEKPSDRNLRPNAGHGLHILEVSRLHTTTVDKTPLDE
jgi:pyridoxine 5'-phosphate synthase PdxJ